jgi:ribonuclease R
LLAKLGTIPIGQALKIGFLKSLMRARYAVEPLGHYGLAKKKYAHFTSPIRRYADLVVHRALFQSSHGSVHSLKQTADHISDTERNSADAERDSKDVKLFAFLKAQLASGQPQRYAALVTDVRNMGFFVDVPELSMSGLVPLSTMEDDFYIFEPARNHLIGRRTRRIIRLGDKVEVQIANVNSFKKQVDFRLSKTSGARPSTAPRPHMDQRRADDRRPMSAQPRARQRRTDDRRPVSTPQPPMEPRRTGDRRRMSTSQGSSPMRGSIGGRDTISTSRPRPSGGRRQRRRR